jgi:hypothetical protein
MKKCRLATLDFRSDLGSIPSDFVTVCLHSVCLSVAASALNSGRKMGLSRSRLNCAIRRFFFLHKIFSFFDEIIIQIRRRNEIKMRQDFCSFFYLFIYIFGVFLFCEIAVTCFKLMQGPYSGTCSNLRSG